MDWIDLTYTRCKVQRTTLSPEKREEDGKSTPAMKNEVIVLDSDDDGGTPLHENDVGHQEDATEKENSQPAAGDDNSNGGGSHANNLKRKATETTTSSSSKAESRATADASKESSSSSDFSSELKKAGFSMFQPLVDLGYFTWNPSEEGSSSQAKKIANLFTNHWPASHPKMRSGATLI